MDREVNGTAEMTLFRAVVPSPSVGAGGREAGVGLRGETVTGAFFSLSSLPCSQFLLP